MIHRLVLVLILFVLPLFAQTAAGEEKVDVHQLVKEQMSEAQAKEKVPSSQNQVVVNEEAKEEDLLNFSSFEMKLIIISSFSSLVLFVVGIRRIRKSKFENKNVPAQQFKQNIQLIRAEKFIKPIDPRLKKIRTNLYLNTRYLNNTNPTISDAAKKLNIAKTELLLAARFNKEMGNGSFIKKQRSISNN